MNQFDSLARFFQLIKKKAFTFSGAIFGISCGVSVELGVASTYEGGLSLFLVNTVQDYAVLAGATTSVGEDENANYSIKQIVGREIGIVEL